jgi:hypothetical protein
MWRGMVAHGLVCVELVWWTNGTVMVESNRDPFMVPSGHIPCKALGGSEMEERNICFSSLLQGIRRCRVVNKKLTLVAVVMMLG